MLLQSKDVANNVKENTQKKAIVNAISFVFYHLDSLT